LGHFPSRLSRNIRAAVNSGMSYLFANSAIGRLIIAASPRQANFFGLICSPIQRSISSSVITGLLLDGYRLQIVKEVRTVRLFSRNGNARASAAVIDGELCLLGAGGRPNFYGLRAAMGRRFELVVFAFDLLHRDGKDLRPLPLVECRRRLERLLARSDVPCLRLVEAFDDGTKLLEAAERHHLEGVVSKRKAAPAMAGSSAS
jgi:ATP dependent DNA ligase domain